MKLEGSIEERNNLDFMYWFNKHALNETGCSIQEICEGKLSEEVADSYIWNISLDSMRERIKVRLH